MIPAIASASKTWKKRMSNVTETKNIIIALVLSSELCLAKNTTVYAQLAQIIAKQTTITQAHFTLIFFSIAFLYISYEISINSSVFFAFSNFLLEVLLKFPSMVVRTWLKKTTQKHMKSMPFTVPQRHTKKHEKNNWV